MRVVAHLPGKVFEVAVAASADPACPSFIPAELEADESERAYDISFEAAQNRFDIGEFSGSLAAFAHDRSRAPVVAGAFFVEHRASSSRVVRRRRASPGFLEGVDRLALIANGTSELHILQPFAGPAPLSQCFDGNSQLAGNLMLIEHVIAVRVHGKTSCKNVE